MAGTVRHRLAAAALAAGCAVLCVAPAAQADYLISQRRAELLARTYLRFDLGYRFAEAVCRPQQGMPPATAGAARHRWTCGFAAGERHGAPSCTGRLLITGSATGPLDHYYRVDQRAGRCEHGL